MPYEAWMLAAIDVAGYNGIQDEYIDSVAQQILRTGITEVFRQVFDTACCRCGIASDGFTQSDLDRLQKRLNA